MRHTLEAIFQVMRYSKKLPQSEKQFIEFTLDLKIAPARPPFPGRPYNEKFATAPTGNPVGIRKTNLLSMVVKQGK